MSSSAVEAPRAGATHRWLAAACIVGAVGLTLLAFTETSEPAAPTTQCQDGPGLPSAPALEGWAPASGPTRAIVARDLQVWTDRATVARAEACNTQPPALGVLACLEAQTALATATVAALEQADPAAQLEAWRLPIALPTSEDCGLVPARGPHDASDPAAESGVLDAAWAAAQLGIRVTDTAAVEAQTSDASQVRARALFVLALHTPDPAERTEALERAVWEAIATDRPALGFRVALALALDPAPPGGFLQAQRWWKLATALDRRLPQAGPRQHALVQTQARLLLRAGKPKEALSLFEVTLSLAESLYSGQHPALVEDLMLSAVAAAQTGRSTAGDALAKRALEIIDAALGARHPLADETLTAYIDALLGAGEPGAAATWARERVRRASPQATSRRAIAAGRLSLAAQDPAAASDAFANAARTVTDAPSAEQPELRMQVEMGLAAAASASGDSEVALGHLRAALAETDDAGSARARVVRSQLIATLSTLERFDEASAEARILLEGLDPAAEPIATADALLALADVALRSGRAEEGLRVSERALGLLVSAKNAADPQVLVALTQVGQACLALGRDEDAVATFERALTLAAAARLPLDEQAATRLALASALWRSRDRTSAETQARAAFAEIQQARGEETAQETAGAWLAQRGLSPTPGPTPAEKTEGNPPVPTPPSR